MNKFAFATRCAAATLVLIGFFSGTSKAEIGGYRLFTPKGNVSTRPDGMVAQAKLEDILIANPDKFDSANMLLPKTAILSETIVRKEPTKDATNAQRQELSRKKQQDLQKLIDDLAGRAVSASFTVIDIIERPEPKLPEYYDRLKDTEYKARLKARYDVEMRLYQRSKMLLVGKVNSTSAPLNTDEEREAMLKSRKSADDRLAQVRSSMAGEKSPAIRRSLENEKARYEKQIQETQLRYRKMAEDRRPVHMFYVLGSDEALLKWKRGQTRNVKAMVERVALFTYGATSKHTDVPKLNDDRKWFSAEWRLEEQEGLQAAYVGIEMVLWLTAEVPDGPIR
jgi:hypothetical protein